MKVILLQDIKNIGGRGELKIVKDGYARNFLFPEGLAKQATETLAKTLVADKEKKETHIAELQTAMVKIINETSKSPLLLQVKVGEKGEIFDSVSSKNIKSELINRFPELKAEHLKIKKDHLRELGSQSVEIDLGRGIDGTVTIEITPEIQK